MAGNKVVLEFAGDATKLAREAKQANNAVEKFGSGVKSTSNDMNNASKSNEEYLGKLSKLGNVVDGASTAIDDAGAAVQAFADIQSAGANKIQKHERALNDVRQAQEDYSQALRDGKQSAIDSDQAEVDLTQARLDQATTLKAYNDAVKEFGRNSVEAKQAQIDMQQAGVDVKQAQEDQAQATRDASQALIDAKGAQLDLNEAQTEANPPDIQKWANDINMYTPLLSGLVGVMGLVTAAQWLWNIAQLASPTTWIILGIVALVAVIVLIATKTRWFQTAWTASWRWIKHAASNTWDFIKKIPGWIGSAFSRVAGFITRPFRSAFNFVADAWNNTIGRLSWSVPGWIPGIGGNSISVPHIPKFHTGGTVPGAPGSEMLAMVQAGETITPAGKSSGSDIIHTQIVIDSQVLMDVISKGVRGMGGNVQSVLGRA